MSILRAVVLYGLFGCYVLFKTVFVGLLAVGVLALVVAVL